MKHKKSPNKSDQMNKYTISEDGLVRLTFHEFKKIPIVHLYSELNADQTPLSDVRTQLSGLTEWMSVNLSPALSVGWQWKLSTLANSTQYEMDGLPFSNIMFIDSQMSDKGTVATNTMLKGYIKTIDWSPYVVSYLNDKYS